MIHYFCLSDLMSSLQIVKMLLTVNRIGLFIAMEKIAENQTIIQYLP